jgi:hypothetical protein
MRKGHFNHDTKPNKKEEITVFVEDDPKAMIIIRDGTRVDVTGNTGETNDPKRDFKIDLGNPPPDTVIYTKTNPQICGWYYFNGRWYYK